MSDSIIGEPYFAIRNRLAGLGARIAQLATQCDASLTIQSPDEAANNSLDAPFRILACGEINAGKSSLINALAGTEISKTSPLPETRAIQCHQSGKAGAPNHSGSENPLVEFHPHSAGFLRHFTLVDTPGTNATLEGLTEALFHQASIAELILVVFPAENPWGASVWNFISSLPEDCLRRMIYVVQQADQKQAADLDVILGHIADLSMKRTGLVPPVFAVSAQQALAARRTQPADPALWKSSGFQPLLDAISQAICQSAQRRNELEIWRARSATNLRIIEDKLEDQTRILNRQNHFLQTVEMEIDTIRESFVRQLPVHLAAVAEVFEREATWVTKVLNRRLAAIPSFIRTVTGDRTGHKMEALFIQRLQEAVIQVAKKDSQEVADTCLRHWNQLGQRVTAELGIELKHDAQPIEEALARAGTHFVERLGKAAEQGIGNLNVRNRLVKDLRRRNLALKSFVTSTLLLTTAGAVCGALEIPWLPWILLILAGLFLTAGTWVAWVTRKTITREFHQRLQNTCGTFASTLRNDYEEALRVVIRDYASCTGHIQSHLAKEQMAIEPRSRMWQELFLTLKAIEQDL